MIDALYDLNILIGTLTGEQRFFGSEAYLRGILMGFPDPLISVVSDSPRLRFRCGFKFGAVGILQFQAFGFCPGRKRKTRNIPCGQQSKDSKTESTLEDFSAAVS